MAQSNYEKDSESSSSSMALAAFGLDPDDSVVDIDVDITSPYSATSGDAQFITYDYFSTATSDTDGGYEWDSPDHILESIATVDGYRDADFPENEDVPCLDCGMQVTNTATINAKTATSDLVGEVFITLNVDVDGGKPQNGFVVYAEVETEDDSTNTKKSWVKATWDQSGGHWDIDRQVQQLGGTPITSSTTFGSYDLTWTENARHFHFDFINHVDMKTQINPSSSKDIAIDDGVIVGESWDPRVTAKAGYED
jgi:hypothetical protein